LHRRKKKGTFGKAPAALPRNFEQWHVKKKLAFLIESLEEVDARQRSQPGWPNLWSDPRVKALIALGDVAVPALIDVIEKDKRLTRSVHFFRDFSRSRLVVSVSMTAQIAVREILRLGYDSFWLEADEAATDLAVQTLRSYWEEYGRYRFAER